ncbi:MAG TPA: hypothetical protein VEH84_14005 [Alphaproteobacteria bacterium]|nr:hypothetical protein [Alphaproteobacteria bacterium]
MTQAAASPLPDAAELLRDLLAALDANDTEAALALGDALRAADGDGAVTAHAFGLMAWRLNRPADAIELFQVAAERAPGVRDHAEALAIAYAQVGNLADSLFYGKLATALAPSEAAGLVPAWLGTFAGSFLAIERAPVSDAASRLDAAGEHAAAQALYEQHLSLNPDDAEAWRRYARSLHGVGLLDQSLRAFSALRALAPEADSDLPLLAGLLAALGRGEASLHLHREAVARSDAPQARAALIAEMRRLPGVRRGDLAAEIRAWAAALPRRPAAPPPPPRRADGTRRLGLIGSRFHGAAHEALLPLFAERLPGWTVSVYADSDRDDAQTRRLRGRVQSWMSLAAVDDPTAPVLLRNEGLDLLIDLDGFAAGARPQLLAGRPAARCLGWLALAETAAETGADAVLGDAALCPPEEGAAIRVEGGLFCWAEGLPPPAPPAEGGPVFGAPVWRGQLSPALAGAWARILRLCPGSRLAVDPARLGGAGGVDELRGLLALHGMADRLLIPPAAADAEAALLAACRVHLAPWGECGPGDTRLAAALGRPTVALAGDRPAARQAAALLHALGLGDLAAASEAEYVARAVAAAAEPADRVAEAVARHRGRLAPAARAAALAAALDAFLDTP